MRIHRSLGIFVYFLLGMAGAFSPPYNEPSTRMKSTSSSLSMGWFNTGSSGGSGSNKHQASSLSSVSKQATSAKPKKSDDWLKNIFSPVHGGGSAKEQDLDEIYKAQQRILADRRKHFDHKTLKTKYKTVGEDHLRDIDTVAHDPKALNQKEDDAMYIDQDHDKKTSFLPWTKKLKP